MRAARGIILGLISVLAVGCSKSVEESKVEPDRLYGKVTKNGQPAKGIIVVALGPNGERKGSSPTDPEGQYRLENPPKGVLKIQIATSPGKRPPPVPGKYQKADKNDLACEYNGGSQQFDIDWK